MDVNNLDIDKINNDNKSVKEESSDVKLEVVPSVDSDKKSSDLSLRGSFSKCRERIQKRKRPRRKSKKGKYPYNKLSWQERRDQENNASERAHRVRQEMFAHGQPVAPYNTTQFLIEDHGDVQDIDAQLQVAQDQIPGGSIMTNKTSRARDSSFSIDSDEDYFYSSPEDEEEFLTKEFSNAYEDLHVERLSSMSKMDIIHDFIQLEAKYEKSIAEIRRLKRNAGEAQDNGPAAEVGRRRREEGDADTDTSSKSENELSEQLRISQLENKTLKMELEELRKENKTLHSLVDNRHSSSSSSSSSVDSDSDSSSSSMTDSSSDEDAASDAEMASPSHQTERSPVRDSENVQGTDIDDTSCAQVNGDCINQGEDEGDDSKNDEVEK